MNDELNGKIMAEFSTFRPKTCNYWRDDSHENRKAQGTKKCAIKQKFEFEDYKNCLAATQLKSKLNQQEQKTHLMQKVSEKIIKHSWKK